MPLILFDTLSRSERALEPQEGRPFLFYCCGPTVYGAAHIGNFRTFILADIVRRVLETSGIQVRHVRNITDVDDKTIRQSQAEGKSLREFTDFWRARFTHDCNALGLFPPHVEPSAVEHIPEQIQLIETLIQGGHAYEKDGSVYYRVSSFKPYGKLSHLREREITTTSGSHLASTQGQRPAHEGCCHPANESESGEHLPSTEDQDEYNRDSPVDFVLWKAHKAEDGANAWPSPWGAGRPGWHIECSAMILKHLGASIDLHLGGVDLIFPHHENEIAQSEAGTGKPFCTHWMHIAHLTVDGAKMSKSLGNLYTLEDIQKKNHTPMELRYVLLSGHYRQPLNFTLESLTAAHSALEKMHRFDDVLRQALPEWPAWKPGASIQGGAFDRAWEALLEDLNTPKALGELFTAIKETEHALRSQKLKPQKLTATALGWQRMLHALGLVLPKKQEVQAPEDVHQLAEARWQAKQNKHWAEADRLRAELAKKGWQMQDGKDGYNLSPLNL